ncbi:hypothetical protein [Actinocorallia populi]|uniref:hypothetical protein n=1 Tax=Actinocorallia populi TaxID=2079200 RepID=UPI000D08AB32|nr:hypothetical protein [Actinocorallia populi]
MAVRTVAASCRGHAWRLVVLLAVLAGLAPGVRLAPPAEPGVLAGVGHVVWDEDCSAPPRLVRVAEQPVVPVAEPSALVVVVAPPVVAWVRGQVWEGAERSWFAVSRAGRAPPLLPGI